MFILSRPSIGGFGEEMPEDNRRQHLVHLQTTSHKVLVSTHLGMNLIVSFYAKTKISLSVSY
jgi:hypothetical protein